MIETESNLSYACLNIQSLAGVVEMWKWVSQQNLKKNPDTVVKDEDPLVESRKSL